MVSRNPVDGVDVFVKLHRLSDSGLFQSYLYDLLLLGREGYISSSALEVLVTSEVADKHRHELVILLGVHPLLDVHEAFGKPHGLVAHIVWAVCLLAALRGVDEIQVRAQFFMTAIGQLSEAAISPRAVVMLALRYSTAYILNGIIAGIMAEQENIAKNPSPFTFSL